MHKINTKQNDLHRGIILGKTFLMLAAMLLMGQVAWAQTNYNPTNYQDLVSYISQCEENDVITLDANIQLEARLEISNGKVVNLQLAGYRLSRNPSETSENGSVIHIAEGGTLNLSNGTAEQNFGTGIISGGNATKGGGILNEGTLVINAVNPISITGNTATQCGSGIWNNGTLKMQGNIQVKDNTDDDVYLKKGKKITVTGTLSGGQNSIGIAMEVADVFTENYQTNNSGNTIHFFPNNTSIYTMGLNNDGEGYVVNNYKYFSCSWDENNKQVVRM